MKSLLYIRNITSRFYSNKKMPKPKKDEKQVANKNVPKSVGPLSEDKSGNILIKIHAKPGSKIDAITDFNEDSIGVQINAPPVEGEANLQLVKYFSQVLGIRKSDVSLEKGSKSRDKVLQIANGNLSLEEIKMKINEEIKRA